jgi:Holliday junction resolvase|tara:strand:+ start:4146 stop:4709 length:564 start_codon:yes stop_codon:yes gene_type:complete
MKRLGPLAGSNGRGLVGGLFYELRKPGIQASYTTKPYDWKVGDVVYPSLKRLYLETLDPTEEAFVQLAFDGNWLQWDRIRNTSALSRFFKRSVSINVEVPWYEEWREELEVKLRSKGIKAIVRIAEDETAQSFSAAKFLATGDWKGRRGRPTKEEKERELRIQTGIAQENAEDLKRMDEVEKRLKVV